MLNCGIGNKIQENLFEVGLFLSRLHSEYVIFSIKLYIILKILNSSIQIWYPNKNRFSNNKVMNQYTQSFLIFRVTIECIPGFVLAPVS